MTIEKIPRTELTKTRANAYMILMTADEGKKLLNQDYVDSIGEHDLGYVDDDTVEPIVCSQVYLSVDGSTLDWVEVDEDMASKIESAYTKYVEDKMTSDLYNTEFTDETSNSTIKIESAD
jgi:hypothetical protein